VRGSGTSPGEEILEAAPEVSAPIAAEDRLALDAAIRALPPEQREVIHLHVFEGLTFKEVALATGEPANTVASRYRYALEKLRASFVGLP
jgi:RNA polymerase sigma-70 factor (ECF subfamily)